MECNEKQEWQQGVIAACLGKRLGLNTSIVSALPADLEFDITQIPDEHANEVFRALKEFFKSGKELPGWYTSWKDSRAAAMKEKLENKKTVGATGSGGDDVASGPGEVAEAGTEGGEAAIASGHGAGAEASTAVGGKFEKGAVVIGIAGKNKDKYDGRKCEILSVLSKQYKVKILEGPAEGETHKYAHNAVKSVHAAEAAPEAAPVASATAEARSSALVPPEEPTPTAVGDQQTAQTGLSRLSMNLEQVFDDAGN